MTTLVNGQRNQLIYQSTAKERYFSTEQIDRSDCNNSIVVLANQVTPGSRILDVGCGQGKLGQILKNENCQIIGIEIDSELREFARASGFYLDVLNINLNDLNPSSREIQRFSSVPEFDYVIFGDVLEHLIDPTTALLYLCDKLKIGGKAMISIPNIAHADVSLHLLNGVFNYMNCGILDNSHLRFFTKKSFAEWILEINGFQDNLTFDCRYLGKTQYSTDFLEQGNDRYPHLISIVKNNPDYDVLQHLFELTKKSFLSKTPFLGELLDFPQVDVIQSIEFCLESANQQTDQYKNDIRFLTDQLQLLKSENESLFSEMTIMRHTLSWKVTSPLRFIRQGVVRSTLYRTTCHATVCKC